MFSKGSRTWYTFESSWVVGTRCSLPEGKGAPCLRPLLVEFRRTPARSNSYNPCDANLCTWRLPIKKTISLRSNYPKYPLCKLELDDAPRFQSFRQLCWRRVRRCEKGERPNKDNKDPTLHRVGPQKRLRSCAFSEGNASAGRWPFLHKASLWKDVKTIKNIWKNDPRKKLSQPDGVETNSHQRSPTVAAFFANLEVLALATKENCVRPVLLTIWATWKSSRFRA